MTLAESIQLCQQIQQARDVAVGCEVKYIDGIPTMYVGFSNYATASKAWPLITQGLAGPFCVAANSVNRQAQLVLAIQDTQLARAYSCETNVWTEWMNYGENKRTNNNRY
jgi:hypothetical protein